MNDDILKDISDVPEKLKDSVIAILKEWGRDDLTGGRK